MSRLSLPHTTLPACPPGARDAALCPLRRLLAGRTPAELARLRGRLLSSEAQQVVSMSDLEDSLGRTQPSCSRREADRHVQWESDFASS